MELSISELSYVPLEHAVMMARALRIVPIARGKRRAAVGGNIMRILSIDRQSEKKSNGKLKMGQDTSDQHRRTTLRESVDHHRHYPVPTGHHDVLLFVAMRKFPSLRFR